MKETLLVVGRCGDELKDIKEIYDVVTFNQTSTLRFYKYRYESVLAVIFLDKFSTEIYDFNLPGLLIIVVTNDKELLEKRWSQNIDVFDIVSEDSFFSNPMLRLQVYKDLMKVIKRCSEKKCASNFTLYMELYRVIHRADEGTGMHNLNSIRLLKILYDGVRRLFPRYANEIQLETVRELQAALLHDVGKIFVPNEILCKPAKLTSQEFSIVKHHVSDGKFVLHRLSKSLPHITGMDACVPYIELHHERWDGRGYPYGLRGDNIPLQARLLSLVDVYDALISKRPYKEAMSHQEAVQVITEGAGTQFDPTLVFIFEELDRGFLSMKNEANWIK